MFDDVKRVHKPDKVMAWVVEPGVGDVEFTCIPDGSCEDPWGRVLDVLAVVPEYLSDLDEYTVKIHREELGSRCSRCTVQDCDVIPF